MKTLFTAIVGLAGFAAGAGELRIPAYTAYCLPDAEGARMSQRGGVRRWNSPRVTVNWYGYFTNAGPLTARLVVRPSSDGGAESKLRLSMGDQSHEWSVKGADSVASVSTGTGAFEVAAPGYHAFTLALVDPPGVAPESIEALLLEGPAVEGAHFNLKERRNAASVHLAYPFPPETWVAAFHCEVTAVEDPVTTFYMACGWHRGYFGMQVNSPTERRIIFSVWDSGNEAVDRDKVAAENRVTLVAKGEGVYSGDFGNEGTGGHSHLKYQWKTGVPQRFLVTAQPTNETFTIFSGYYFHPDRRDWMLISSWRAPKEGGWLKRLHSFSENFWGSTGHLVRKALYGRQWIRTDQRQWIELTTASFSHDPTGRSDRLDRFMGVEQRQFFLSHGGFIEGSTTFGETFSRPSDGEVPLDLERWVTP